MNVFPCYHVMVSCGKYHTYLEASTLFLRKTCDLALLVRLFMSVPVASLGDWERFISASAVVVSQGERTKTDDD